MIDLTKFNEQQYEAIVANDPYIKVIAGAGSGKTAVLTNRIAYLVEEKKVSPKNILAITFTNKAAKEMKKRVVKLLESEYFAGVITTFHSFCLRVLREDINLLGYTKDFLIIDSDDQKTIIKNINKELGYDKEYFKPKTIIAYISNIKNEYYPEELNETYERIYQQFYEKYESYLKENNALDFDDLILKCNILFENHSIILDKWRFRYHYIHVDEFQDTNSSQYNLVKMLGLELNVFVVGDPDQTIYTWRGAKINFILDFEKDFKNTRLIKLEYNYRSQESILALANDLIQHNDDRIEKKLIATRKDGAIVEHYIAQNASDEASFVVAKIEEIINEVEGVNYEDFAILYRSNYISRVFEQYLSAARIDYKIIGGIRFFERKEIKDILAYLRVILNKDNISLLRIINTPKRKIGQKALEKIENYSKKIQKTLFETISMHLHEIGLTSTQTKELEKLVNVIINTQSLGSGKEMAYEVLHNFDILEDYHKNSLEYQTRNDNIQELLAFLDNQKDDLNSFLQELVLDNNENNENISSVSLMSMHSAKGLEFKYVFVVHLCDGIFPSLRSLENQNLQEERRLAYVAFTRAKEQLFLCSHLESIQFQRMSKSLFIEEVEEDLIRQSGKVQTKITWQRPTQEESVNKDITTSESNTQYKIQDIVYHSLFKKGIVIGVNNDILTIAFENKIGIKQIRSDFVTKKE